MKTIFIPRVIQIVIQDDRGFDKIFYQLFVNGKRGTIYSLNGQGIAYITYEHIKEIGNYAGIDKIMAVMTDRAYQHLYKNLPKEVVIEVGEKYAMDDGTEVNELTFTLAEAKATSQENLTGSNDIIGEIAA